MYGAEVTWRPAFLLTFGILENGKLPSLRQLELSVCRGFVDSVGVGLHVLPSSHHVCSRVLMKLLINRVFVLVWLSLRSGDDGYGGKLCCVGTKIRDVMT